MKNIGLAAAMGVTYDGILLTAMTASQKPIQIWIAVEATLVLVALGVLAYQARERNPHAPNH